MLPVWLHEATTSVYMGPPDDFIAPMLEILSKRDSVLGIESMAFKSILATSIGLFLMLISNTTFQIAGSVL